MGQWYDRQKACWRHLLSSNEPTQCFLEYCFACLLIHNSSHTAHPTKPIERSLRMLDFSRFLCEMMESTIDRIAKPMRMCMVVRWLFPVKRTSTSPEPQYPSDWVVSQGHDFAECIVDLN